MYVEEIEKANLCRDALVYYHIWHRFYLQLPEMYLNAGTPFALKELLEFIETDWITLTLKQCQDAVLEKMVKVREAFGAYLEKAEFYVCRRQYDPQTLSPCLQDRIKRIERYLTQIADTTNESLQSIWEKNFQFELAAIRKESPDLAAVFEWKLSQFLFLVDSVLDK